jgi:hypothetical protein
LKKEITKKLIFFKRIQVRFSKWPLKKLQVVVPTANKAVPRHYCAAGCRRHRSEPTAREGVPTAAGRRPLDWFP